MANRSVGESAVAVDVHRLAADHAHAVELGSSGKHKDAASFFAKTLEGCREVLGEQHDVTLTVAGNLAVTLLLAGRRKDGMALLEANLADRVRVWGDEDPRTLTARDAYAVALRIAGRVDDAVSVSALVTSQRTRVLGAAQPDTLTSRMGLVQARAAAGDIGSASALLIAALADAEQALAEDRREDALKSYNAALGDAERWAVPADVATVAISYGDNLIASADFERASAVIGRVARFADHDFDCALLQARLYHALGQRSTWQTALERARALAGERAIPAALQTPPESHAS